MSAEEDNARAVEALNTPVALTTRYEILPLNLPNGSPGICLQIQTPAYVARVVGNYEFMIQMADAIKKHCGQTPLQLAPPGMQVPRNNGSNSHG